MKLTQCILPAYHLHEEALNLQEQL